MPFQTQGVVQTLYTPSQLGFATTAAGTAVVAASPVTSSVIDTRNRSQLTLSLKITRNAATAWAVYFEYSPDYHTLGPSSKASANWIRVQADSVGAIAAGACTITLGDATWSFTTSTSDTLHIDLPVNAPAYRFTVTSTLGDASDFVLAWVTLGNP